VKVSVIGASGNVGSTTAFCLAEENSVNDLVLISRKESINRIEGEALDIHDALAAKGIDISIKTSFNLEDIEDSNMIVMTAGIPRKPGMSRRDLGAKNAKIVANYSREVSKFSPDSVMLVITNPVDVMTYVALKTSGLDENKVFGLGNHLDSLRLKNLIAKHFKIHVSEVHTRIIGEHGDNMVPLISSTAIGGIPLRHFSEYENFDIQKNVDKVKNAGNNIISKKYATEYGPAYAISNIVNTVLNDEKRILTVTTYLDGEYKIEEIKDVCLGVPAKLGINGIDKKIPIEMDEKEIEAFIKAAKSVKKTTTEVMIKLLELDQ